MQYTINQLRQEIFSKVFEVYDIFLNFFGEPHVDLQDVPDDPEIESTLTDYGIDINQLTETQITLLKSHFSSLRPTILVWWPRVTVTNENNRSIIIYDLYARIYVTLEGRIPYEFRGFQLTRTTFPEVQYTSGYLHSHIPHFSQIPNFDNPCLGRGPINNTIMDLKNNYEETTWMLFCQELSLYVTVESLTGGPYFRMETLGSQQKLYEYTGYSNLEKHINIGCLPYDYFQREAPLINEVNERKEMFKTFLQTFALYYLEHGHLSLSFKDGMFIPGMPYYEFIIDISNAFIDFFNSQGNVDKKEDLFASNVLHPAIFANNSFYKSDYQPSNHTYEHEGRFLFRFKGEPKRLHIIRDNVQNENTLLVLSHNIATYLLNNILKVINYRFENEHNNTPAEGTSLGTTASAPKTVCYL